MQTFQIYLAGAISGVTFEKSNEWRRYARIWLELRESDYKIVTVNPNDYYNFNEKLHDTEEEIRRFDIRKVGQSDLILVNLNDDSIGTAMELQHAFDNNIAIVGFTDHEDELHPWLWCVCDKVLDSIGGALRYVRDYYL